MQLSPDRFLGPKWPRDSEDQYTGIGNLPEWPSCPHGHSLCSTKMPSAADIGRLLLIHATLLADHAWNTSIRMANGLTDSAITFRKSIWKLADRDDPTLPACSYRSLMCRILLKGSST